MSMLHKLRVTASRGTATREIRSQDESHDVAEGLLKEWKAAMTSLLATLDANTAAWAQVFASYTDLQSSMEAIYSSDDNNVRGCVNALQKDRAKIGQSSSSDPSMLQAPIVKMERSKDEVRALLERIGNAEKLQATRLNVTKDCLYYERRTTQLKQKGQGTTFTKLTNTEKSSAESLNTLNNLKAQLSVELKSMDVERLAVADRAVSAMLHLQDFYYQANPGRSAFELAGSIGLGTRSAPLPPRDWNALQPGPGSVAAALHSVPTGEVQQPSADSQPFATQQIPTPQSGYWQQSYTPQAQGYQSQQNFMQSQQGHFQAQQGYLQPQYPQNAFGANASSQLYQQPNPLVSSSSAITSSAVSSAAGFSSQTQPFLPPHTQQGGRLTSSVSYQSQQQPSPGSSLSQDANPSVQQTQAQFQQMHIQGSPQQSTEGPYLPPEQNSLPLQHPPPLPSTVPADASSAGTRVQSLPQPGLSQSMGLPLMSGQATGAAPLPQQGSWPSAPQQGSWATPTQQGSWPAPTQQGSWPAPTQQGSWPAPSQQGSWPNPTPQPQQVNAPSPNLQPTNPQFSPATGTGPGTGESSHFEPSAPPPDPSAAAASESQQVAPPPPPQS